MKKMKKTIIVVLEVEEEKKDELCEELVELELDRKLMRIVSFEEEEEDEEE